MKLKTELVTDIAQLVEADPSQHVVIATEPPPTKTRVRVFLSNNAASVVLDRIKQGKVTLVTGTEPDKTEPQQPITEQELEGILRDVSVSDHLERLSSDLMFLADSQKQLRGNVSMKTLQDIATNFRHVHIAQKTIAHKRICKPE